MRAPSLLRKVTGVLSLSVPASSLVVSPIAAGVRGLARTSARSVVSATASLEAPVLPAVVTAEPATHPAFELLKVEMVDEYTIKCATYRHKKSGAELISAQANDDNKVFGIVFRTPVTDSTGVPHILEHSVLCGSDKYTSKEPFVELLKGSLQTFLNAFTYPDRTWHAAPRPALARAPRRARAAMGHALHAARASSHAAAHTDRRDAPTQRPLARAPCTVSALKPSGAFRPRNAHSVRAARARSYPVASQNTKDFYNLVNVYLDAVLHPRAKRDPTVLAQEGWHYELEQPDDPLTFKVSAPPILP
jgi:hypothetical protein